MEGRGFRRDRPHLRSVGVEEGEYPACRARVGAGSAGGPEPVTAGRTTGGFENSLAVAVCYGNGGRGAARCGRGGAGCGTATRS